MAIDIYYFLFLLIVLFILECLVIKLLHYLNIRISLVQLTLITVAAILAFQFYSMKNRKSTAASRFLNRVRELEIRKK